MTKHRFRGPTRRTASGAEPVMPGDLRTERDARDAIVTACAMLLRRLKAEHPQIVRHLQSLPDAQRIVVDDYQALD